MGQVVVVRPPLDAVALGRLLVPGRSLSCDVSALVDVDLAAVDALARLCLDARRRGTRLHLLGATTELQELLDLAGLAQALTDSTARS